MKGDTVEVLVRIPKKDFEELQSNYVWWGKHGDYIKNGTVLPKGHGRLIDADIVTKDINAFQDAFAMYTDNMGKYNIVCTAPTVIEADKDGDADESDAEFMCKAMSKTVNKSTDDRNFIGGC